MRKLHALALVAVLIAGDAVAQTCALNNSPCAPDLSAYAKTVNGYTPDATGAVTIPAASYVAGFTPGAPGLVASLLTNQPCVSTSLGMYASVSNLFGSTNEVMRCAYTSGFGYYWRPQRTDFAAIVAQASGTYTLTPLVTPPILQMSTTLTGNVTVTPSATNAWPGLCFTVANTSTLGVFTMTVTGVIGANQLLAALGTKQVCYTGTGYTAF